MTLQRNEDYDELSVHTAIFRPASFSSSENDTSTLYYRHRYVESSRLPVPFASNFAVHAHAKRETYGKKLHA